MSTSSISGPPGAGGPRGSRGLRRIQLRFESGDLVAAPDPKDPNVVKIHLKDLDDYVTRKSLDGLFFMVGEEEKKIRQNPIGAGSDIIKKVFGALK